MKNYSFASLAAALALLLTLGALPVLAQTSPPELATWDTQVWPEYDQPAVLVITSGAFVNGTSFPQQVRVPIPAGAVVHAVAYPEASGNLLSLAWTAEPGVDGQTVVFDLNQPSFVVEYYADIITPPPSRSFEMNLVAPYAVQQASLALRQPARSSDLQTTPAMAAGGVDDLGNLTYTLDLGAMAAGASTPLQVSYTKADAQPSVANAATAAVAPERSSVSPWWPWVAGVAAAVLAGGVTFYLVQRRRSTSASRQSRRASSAARSSKAATSSVATAALPGVSAVCYPGGSYDDQQSRCAHQRRRLARHERGCASCGARRPQPRR